MTALSPPKRSDLRLRHIGLVFQFGELLPEMTALENVALPLRLLGTSRLDAEEKAEEWLERLGLGGLGDRRPAVLSGGEVQRVGIARALAHEPRLVLADEPTGALDEENTARIAELFVGTAKEDGATVLVTTHDPIVASMADRTLRLHEGRLTPACESDDPTAV